MLLHLYGKDGFMMRMVDIIQKKRDGLTLTKDEIQFCIHGYANGQIPDYQMSALAMAIYFQGMSSEEISNLTMEMVNTGDIMDLSPIEGIIVDKHSTGGVGDKTSLIVAPLVASVGIPVAKMSGRGLGHTGGTLDKLESIPGFQIELSKEQFIRHVNQFKLALVSQTGNLVPADKKLYALRDVTATVNSIPLIASSVMSKKIASGADAIVLDVKVGSGAFMKSLKDAKQLAETMVMIGKHLNRKTTAILTDMNEPLGYEVGNANEVKEAIEVLKGRGEQRLTELCLTIAAHMAVLGKKFETVEEAKEGLYAMLKEGRALHFFKQFVQAQGGDAMIVENDQLFPSPKYNIEVKSDKEGFVEEIQAEEIGIAAMWLGAGRATKEDKIDYSAGITLLKKVGDRVHQGEPIAILRSNIEQMDASLQKVKQAYRLSDQQVQPPAIIYEVISSSS